MGISTIFPNLLQPAEKTAVKQLRQKIILGGNPQTQANWIQIHETKTSQQVYSRFLLRRT